jgi:hypothetical protein
MENMMAELKRTNEEIAQDITKNLSIALGSLLCVTINNTYNQNNQNITHAAKLIFLCEEKLKVYQQDIIPSLYYANDKWNELKKKAHAMKERIND